MSDRPLRLLDLNGLVRGLDGPIRETLGAGVEYRTALAPGALPILVDPDLAGEAVLHLAANARDAMPGGGTFTIRTQEAIVEAEPGSAGAAPPPGNHAVIAAADTGIGMSAGARSLLLGALAAGDEADAPGAPGGPARVLRFARRSGGGVRIEGEPGAGTTWLLYLPKAVISRPAAAREATVLLVEDEDTIRRLATTILGNRGHRVIAAADAEAALALSRGTPGRIDLLLADVRLPGMDGIALSRRVVAERPGIRVLLVTGAGREDLRSEGLRTEGFPLLRKPYTPATLAGRVRSVLEGPPFAP